MSSRRVVKSKATSTGEFGLGLPEAAVFIESHDGGRYGGSSPRAGVFFEECQMEMSE